MFHTTWQSVSQARVSVLMVRMSLSWQSAVGFVRAWLKVRRDVNILPSETVLLSESEHTCKAYSTMAMEGRAQAMCSNPTSATSRELSLEFAAEVGRQARASVARSKLTASLPLYRACTSAPEASAFATPGMSPKNAASNMCWLASSTGKWSVKARISYFCWINARLSWIESVGHGLVSLPDGSNPSRPPILALQSHYQSDNQCRRFSRNIAQVTPKSIYFYYRKKNICRIKVSEFLFKKMKKKTWLVINGEHSFESKCPTLRIIGSHQRFLE